MICKAAMALRLIVNLTLNIIIIEINLRSNTLAQVYTMELWINITNFISLYIKMNWYCFHVS